MGTVGFLFEHDVEGTLGACQTEIVAGEGEEAGTLELLSYGSLGAGALKEIADKAGVTELTRGQHILTDGVEVGADLILETLLAGDILRHAVHQHEIVPGGDPMWEPENKYIRFVPGMKISDPSSHLPHFYELFALKADEEDRAFWKQAAEASRK